MHNFFLKNLATVTAITFVLSIQTLTVFAGTGALVPAPPVGVPGDTEVSPEDEITEDRDFGSGDNTLESRGGESGGFFDERGGEAGLRPPQNRSPYQGQVFSRG